MTKSTIIIKASKLLVRIPRPEVMFKAKIHAFKLSNSAESSLSGPVNFVSSDPVTNAGFAKTLGHVIGRPALFPAPAFMLRAAMGEMADALLLSSARVKPSKLTESGYRYRFNDLTQFLKYSLGRERLESTE